jgi:D-alanine-D-alanine ligase
MKRRLHIAVLVDPGMIAADDPQFTASSDTTLTEYHVCEALRLRGHEVEVLGAERDILAVAQKLRDRQPDLVFNLTEQFCGDRRMDKHLATLLEMLDLPFTGAGAMGLLLARDKRLCKQILALHHIRVPDFISLPYGRAVRVPRHLRYPVVVKPVFEDGSEGIAKASLVHNAEALRERAAFVHERWQQPVIAEEYIEGRELYVGVLGNKRLTVLPPRECFFQAEGGEGPVILTYRCKWNREYREKWKITFGHAELDPLLLRHIARVCKRAYRVLQLQDYGRMDLRLTPDGRVVVLEANPNPDIAYGEEVAEAADKIGLDYESLIDRIIHLALARYR